MASGWVKSLHCKSRAYDDVSHPYPKTLLPVSSSCRRSAQTIKDVVETAKRKPRRGKDGTGSDPLLPPATSSKHARAELGRVSSAGHVRRSAEPIFPALTELPEGHPSRNVVEIIFHTSWSPKAFSGRIEMIFKVQNGPKTVAHFEEYREAVKSRARSWPREGGSWDEDARCAADGNEVMRFRCMGPTSSCGGEYDPTGGAWGLQTGKGTSSICTFSGSGWAHESAGGGRGRRAMLVCRVIAGRVSKQTGFDPFSEERVMFESDSVSGDNGELLVFDSRAVLPCFLIIYRL